MNRRRFIVILGSFTGKWAARLLVGTLLAYFCTLVFSNVQLEWFVVGFIFGEILERTNDPVTDLANMLSEDASDVEER